MVQRHHAQTEQNGSPGQPSLSNRSSSKKRRRSNVLIGAERPVVDQDPPTATAPSVSDSVRATAAERATGNNAKKQPDSAKRLKRRKKVREAHGDEGDQGLSRRRPEDASASIPLAAGQPDSVQQAQQMRTRTTESPGAGAETSKQSGSASVCLCSDQDASIAQASQDSRLLGSRKCKAKSGISMTETLTRSSSLPRSPLPSSLPATSALPDTAGTIQPCHAEPPQEQDMQSSDDRAQEILHAGTAIVSIARSFYLCMCLQRVPIKICTQIIQVKR